MFSVCFHFRLVGVRVFVYNLVIVSVHRILPYIKMYFNLKFNAKTMVKRMCVCILDGRKINNEKKQF